MRITTRTLRRLGACRTDTRVFGELFPDGVEVKDITPALVLSLLEEDIDVEWFCDELAGWDATYDATKDAWNAWHAAGGRHAPEEAVRRLNEDLAPGYARLIRDALTGPDAEAKLAKFGSDR